MIASYIAQSPDSLFPDLFRGREQNANKYRDRPTVNDMLRVITRP
jgi:hypothetical protein